MPLENVPHPRAGTLQEVTPLLQWQVQRTGWGELKKLLDLEEMIALKGRERRMLLHQIGRAYVDSGDPNSSLTDRVHDLDREIESLEAENASLHTQYRLLIRHALGEVFQEGRLETLKSDEIEAYLRRTEDGARTQLSLTRALTRGLEKLRQKENPSPRSEA